MVGQANGILVLRQDAINPVCPGIETLINHLKKKATVAVPSTYPYAVTASAETIVNESDYV